MLKNYLFPRGEFFITRLGNEHAVNYENDCYFEVLSKTVEEGNFKNGHKRSKEPK